MVLNPSFSITCKVMVDAHWPGRVGALIRPAVSADNRTSGGREAFPIAFLMD